MIPQLLIEFRKYAAGDILRTLANCVLPERRAPVTVLLGAARGITMSLYLRYEKYYWLGIYEYKIQKFLMEIIRPDSVFYDLGANIGFYSLLVAGIAGPSGRCFAFEPVASNVRRLEWNIKLNQMDQIHVIPMAVSNKVETAIFRLGANHSMGTLCDNEALQITKNCIAIPVTTIDHFVFSEGNPPPDIIKIDIEGGEGNAMTGMIEVLKRFRPYLVCEVSGGDSALKIWDALKHTDYRVYDVNKNLIESVPNYINIIAVPAERDWKC